MSTTKNQKGKIIKNWDELTNLICNQNLLHGFQEYGAIFKTLDIRNAFDPLKDIHMCRIENKEFWAIGFEEYMISAIISTNLIIIKYVKSVCTMKIWA